MSLILVVEKESRYVERIHDALSAEGWEVQAVASRDEALAVASDRGPDLTLVSSEVEGADRLLRAFCRREGGPGVVALVPETGGDPQPADEVLGKPFTAQEVRLAVRRCLARRHETMKPEGPALTSEELFGDVLAEVGEEVEGAGMAAEGPPAARQPPTPAESDEVSRQLEETLSGVLELGKKKRRTGGPPRGASDEVDQLLSDTLSGLGVKSKRKSEPVPPPPEPDLDPAATQRLSSAELAGLIEEEKVQREVEAGSPPEAEGEPEEPLAAVEEPAEAEVAASTPPPERRRFGQYILLDRIAVGGMAEVWKARMKGVEGFQKNVAIKKILSHLTDSVDFVTMFIDEAKLAAQLNHNNIIHIYDLGKIDSDYYIAMEYVEGKDLRSILNAARKKGLPLPLGISLLIACRLASALDYAHRKRDFENRELGLVHRDVSPQNVLISYEGDIKLCDFGIVKAVAKASKTQMGALKGKLQYMSPEQAWGRVVDARTDIFSLGAVLFEMLTGQRLFSGDSEISVLEAVRECRIEPPRSLDPSIPPEVDAIVLRALAREPDDRYQTANDLQKELEGVLYALDPTPGNADLARYMQQLFGAEAAAAEEPRELSPVGAEPSEESSVPGVAEGGTPEVEAMPSLGEVAAAEEGHHGRGWLLAAAGVVVVVAAIIFFMRAGEAPPAPAPAPPEATGAEVTEVPPIEAEGETPGAVTETPAPEAAAAESAPEEQGVDVEQIVEDRLREQEAALTRELEARKLKLESELEEVQAREKLLPEPAAEAAGAPAQDAAETVPAPAAGGTSVAEEAPVAVTEETGLREGVTGEVPREGQEPVEPSVEAVAPTPVLTTRPRPAAPPKPKVSPTPVPSPTPSVRIGELVSLGDPGVEPPSLLTWQAPAYPPIARRLRVEGTVVVAVLVDEKGQVADVQMVEPVAQKVGINEAALEAARTAEFRPATKDGVPVKVWYNMRIPFKL